MIRRKKICARCEFGWKAMAGRWPCTPIKAGWLSPLARCSGRSSCAESPRARRSGARCRSWTSSGSQLTLRKPKDASNGCSVPCRTAWSKRCAGERSTRWKRPIASWNSPSGPGGKRVLQGVPFGRVMPIAAWKRPIASWNSPSGPGGKRVLRGVPFGRVMPIAAWKRPIDYAAFLKRFPAGSEILSKPPVTGAGLWTRWNKPVLTFT